jgi:hypothetical protein
MSENLPNGGNDSFHLSADRQTTPVFSAKIVAGRNTMLLTA